MSNYLKMASDTSTSLRGTPWSRRAIGAVLGTLLGAMFALEAQALELDARRIDGRRVIIAQGEFVEGDGARLANLIDRIGRPDEVWLHSGGGAMHEGYRVGRLMRERGLTTRVPARARCASACTDAFLGGVRRIVDAERSLGVHMPTVSRNAQAQGWVTGQVEQRGNAASGNVIRTFEQFGAKAAAEWIKYLHEMGISADLVQIAVQVSANDMRWLSAEEMRRLNVVTDASGSRVAGASRRSGTDDGLPRIN